MSPDCSLIVHASHAAVKTWVEGEIGDIIASRRYVPTITGVVEALGRGLASANHLLIVDFDDLPADGIAELRAGIEACWWRGTLIGLGREQHRHARALKIAHTIPRPFGSEALRALVTSNSHRDTQPIVVTR